MKALSTTIVLAVTVTVILIVALVVLTIFSTGTSTAIELTNYKNNCINMCSVTCKMNAMPPTWSIDAYVSSLKKTTNCKTETGIDECSKCGGISSTAKPKSHTGLCNSEELKAGCSQNNDAGKQTCSC